MRHVIKAFIVAYAVLSVQFAIAEQTDPHLIYEQNCAACHAPHAGEFAFEELDVTENGLAGKNSGHIVLDLLNAGHGKISENEISILIEHLGSIRRSGRLYRKKCIICHDNAARFARLNLIMRDGELMGRYTDRDVAEFLTQHGRLNASEVQKILGVLTRQLTVR